jgi:hypothetical protein
LPQAQAAQQRLKHESAPPSYGQFSNFSKVHRREVYLASVQMKLVIFTLLFCSSAEFDDRKQLFGSIRSHFQKKTVDMYTSKGHEGRLICVS